MISSINSRKHPNSCNDKHSHTFQLTIVLAIPTCARFVVYEYPLQSPGTFESSMIPTVFPWDMFSRSLEHSSIPNINPNCVVFCVAGKMGFEEPETWDLSSPKILRRSHFANITEGQEGLHKPQKLTDIAPDRRPKPKIKLISINPSVSGAMLVSRRVRVVLVFFFISFHIQPSPSW